MKGDDSLQLGQGNSDMMVPAAPTAQMTQGKKKDDIFSLVQNKKKEFESALGGVITSEKFVRVALTALRKNDKLQECNKLSVLGALMLSAQLGLEPNTPLGHAYLIPYGKECQFIIGYQGLLDLVYRSGIVKRIMVFDRCKNDMWDMQWGSTPEIKHIPSDDDRGEILGYYAIATMQNGIPIFSYMSLSDIEKHRKQYSKDGGNFSPWKTAYPEMCKKTVLRRLIKMLPKATDTSRIVFESMQEGTVKGHDSEFQPIIDDTKEAEYEEI